MNTTLKYVLIGGGALAAVFIVAKAVTPATPTSLQSIASGLGSIGSTLSNIFGNKPPPSDAPADSNTDDASYRLRPNVLGDKGSSLKGYSQGDGGAVAWSSLGDAAISDGGGYSRLSGKNQQPANNMNRAQATQINNGAGYFTLGRS